MWIVIALVLQFIVRSRFPLHKSIAQVVTDRYGPSTVHLIRKLESLDFKHRKCELDIVFLNKCIEHDLVPKFVQFKVANRGLRSSKVYKQCQRKLIQEELSAKKRSLAALQKKLDLVKRQIRDTVRNIDFLHICTKFLVLNDRKIRRVCLVHEKKLVHLGLTTATETNDPEKVIFNFSNRTLTNDEKLLLVKGLNLSVPPKKLNYGDFLLPFEQTFYQIHADNPDLTPEEIDPVCATIKSAACDCFKTFDPKLEQNLPDGQVEALKSLLADDNIIIQKSDKGNSVVILNKSDYVTRMHELLADTSKFQKLDIQGENDYNYIINQQIHITTVLGDLKKKGAMTHSRYEELRPVGTQPSVLYGLGKVHKATVNNIPKLRPILSAINTPTYKLSQYLNSLMKPLTTNQYTAKDSFTFTEDIRKQDSKLSMASLDVDSLFTNIPLEETIDICCELLYKDTDTVDGLSKVDFRELLSIATRESFILFDGQYFKQIDGVAMGSPLGPTLANIFLGYNEEKWLANCPSDFKPVYYRRYVDDIFLLFNNMKCLDEFKRYMNNQHPNMNFTSESELDNALAFLDVYVRREGNGFVTSVYRKPTFSGVYTNFDSYIPTSYKSGLVYTLLYRSYMICTKWHQVDKEFSKIRSFMLKNGYPSELFDRTLTFFLNKLYTTKPSSQSVESKVKNYQIILPYLGSFTKRLEKRIKLGLNEHLPHVKITFVYRASTRLRNLFAFKDKIPSYIRSGFVYKFTCASCKAVYIGETNRHQKTRFCEHMGVSALTGKELSCKKPSHIRDHLKHCRTTITKDCFEVIGYDSTTRTNLRIKESLFIHRDKPSINVQGASIPLKLFRN